jgi:hypothetical protein
MAQNEIYNSNGGRTFGGLKIFLEVAGLAVFILYLN